MIADQRCQPGEFFVVPNSAMGILALDQGNAAFLVFIALCKRSNSKGECWPTKATIAHDIGMSTETVKRAIRTLREAGHIKVAYQDGKGSVYQITPTEGGGTPMTQVTHDPGHPCSTGGVTHDPGGGSPVTPITRSKNKNQEQGAIVVAVAKNGRRKRAIGYSEDFKLWWSHYPKKEAKGKAAETFESVVPALVADDDRPEITDTPSAITFLCERADRYARKVAGKDDQYIKHPATWLNYKCFDDEDAQPTSIYKELTKP